MKPNYNLLGILYLAVKINPNHNFTSSDEPPEPNFFREASVSSNQSESSIFENSTRTEQFNQEDMSDLIRNLNLSKKALELLASKLKKRNALVLVQKSLFTALGKSNYFNISIQRKHLFSVQMLKNFF